MLTIDGNSLKISEEGGKYINHWVPPSGGVYAVEARVTNRIGLQNSVNAELIVYDNELYELSLYPIPASDILTFKGKTYGEGIVEVAFYDMNGYLLVELEESVSQEFQINIPLENLSKGFYLSKISYSDRQYFQKLIIE